MRRGAWTVILALAVLAGGCASAASRKGSARKPPLNPTQKMALRHYKLGIDAYVNSRYAEAIQHWKITKEKDPGNANADEYIQRAEAMLNALKQAPKTAPR